MKIISSVDINNLGLDPVQSVEWVREAFLLKERCQLPPKISLHPRDNDFINTMPCILPEEYHTYGCKVVSRVSGTTPSLKSKLLVCDTNTGIMTALIDADWITARRTGAVAALAINTLRHSKAKIYSFLGLGVIGHATLDCFLATNTDSKIIVRLLRYKDHAQLTIDRYSGFSNVSFEIADTIEQLVDGADVVVSCITYADGLLVNDVTLFKPGVLVVPVHTRGFQNCDTIFDKVFADDTGHVSNFKYFKEFRAYDEISNVLAGKNPGRQNDDERILSYNIGLGLHDIYFAHKILNLID